jgi:hypothetical protein
LAHADFALLYLIDEIDLESFPAIALNADNTAYQESSGDVFAAGNMFASFLGKKTLFFIMDSFFSFLFFAKKIPL